MHIAQVAPLFESVPPKFYGGTERVVSYLSEELIRRGHKVTLFASGDSLTTGELVATGRRALRLDPDSRFPLYPHLIQLGEVLSRYDDFDVVHFHTEPYIYPFLKRLHTPTLITQHWRLDSPEFLTLQLYYKHVPVVSISDHQRLPLPGANWMSTIYHGLPRDLYRLHTSADGYLAFLGRISPEKGVDQAIEIARRCGRTIKIAAKIDDANMEYFQNTVKPLLSEPFVEFLGEIGESEKNEFLGRASALVFPISWPEPFGMVLIESMACGTPVIGYRCGSVPEIIRSHVSGFIVNDIEEAVQAVARISDIDRTRCRTYFEQYFSVERMAQDYLAVYERLIRENKETKFDFSFDHPKLFSNTPLEARAD